MRMKRVSRFVDRTRKALQNLVTSSCTTDVREFSGVHGLVQQDEKVVQQDHSKVRQDDEEVRCHAQADDDRRQAPDEVNRRSTEAAHDSLPSQVLESDRAATKRLESAGRDIIPTQLVVYSMSGRVLLDLEVSAIAAELRGMTIYAIVTSHEANNSWPFCLCRQGEQVPCDAKLCDLEENGVAEMTLVFSQIKRNKWRS
eukprot:gb/GFBE01061440.1/.p1 GENE.gb/GFBE01061440.1/~~gb/GFBE01061440.1/.p1  ORF type:complete len:199 (+),score=25.87 gb/GFBE01061440.1/:1-597(+)